jgi:hypothetical protein
LKEQHLSKPKPDKNTEKVVKGPKTWTSNSAIGAALRKAYSDIANEPIPEDLDRLLDVLRKKETDR